MNDVVLRVPLVVSVGRPAVSAVYSLRRFRLGKLYGENTMLRRPCLSSYCGLVREMNGVFRPYSANPFSFLFFSASIAWELFSLSALLFGV